MKSIVDNQIEAAEKEVVRSLEKRTNASSME
jgi:hypothetical protein